MVSAVKEAVREASELGFPPGQWPEYVEFEGHRLKKRYWDTYAEHMVYSNGQILLVVLND